MLAYLDLLSDAQPITDHLFFRPLPGVDALPLSATPQPSCSYPGQDVFVDVDHHCVITRTSSGVYLSLQKSRESVAEQLSAMERIARLYSSSPNP